MARSTTPYHRGDLPDALVRAAVELLEEAGSSTLSLRAAARRAGVSTAAPYRHFADREALLSAVAAVGYRELGAELMAAQPNPRKPEDLVPIAVRYVRFALDRPGMFRVMFAEPCDTTNLERVAAVHAMNDYLTGVVRKIFPKSDAEAMADAVWSLVHGLAFLFLEGKFDASRPKVVADRVRTTVLAVLKPGRRR